MDFETLKQYKPHIPFQVIEKDLNRDPELRHKLFFDEADARINHSNEMLANGSVEMPVFKDKTIRPLGFKGKMLDYTIENKGGGFYVITQKRGKISPKSNDRQHPHEEIEDTKTFFIAYDKDEKKYKYLENEKNFLEMYQEIENLKTSPEVQTIINDFIDWIQTFWTPEYKARHNLGSNTSQQTYQNHLDVIQDLKNTIPTLKKYHLLLNLFGDITDESLKKIYETIDTLQEHMEQAETLINNHFSPNEIVDSSKLTDLGYGNHNPLTDLHTYFQNIILERAYFINPETNTVHPTIGELFKGNQFSDVFESDRTKKERIAELRDAAKNNFFKYTPPVKN
ncbi:hypothetical protein AAGG74_23335 [Bacillus mexicanus]|uniref:hypothetical protein n=1 Tax=Bacillus mexicanus TaxID=2834415 RepID=UPI003D1EBD86